MKDLTLIETLKNYEQSLTTLGFTVRKNWEKDLLFARRMKGNSTKISYLDKDKLKGLKKNVEGFELNPECKEQREKYFNAVRPSKFLYYMLDKTNTYNDILFDNISKTFSKQFIQDLPFVFKTYEGKEIGERYESGRGVVGCMSGKDKEWFECYGATKDLRLVCLEDDNGGLLVRALLWFANGKYFLDVSYEQATINGDEDTRKYYQYKLYKCVLSFLNKRKIDCAFLSYIRSYTTVMQKDASSSPSNDMQPKIITPRVFEHLPYADNFKGIHKESGVWYKCDKDGNLDYHWLNSQEGRCSNDRTSCCESCAEYYDDDDMIWSEHDEVHYCNDCAIYCEDREDYRQEDDTIYDNYRGVSCFRDDLDY